MESGGEKGQPRSGLCTGGPWGERLCVVSDEEMAPEGLFLT